jgi:hypothetical protein
MENAKGWAALVDALEPASDLAAVLFGAKEGFAAIDERDILRDLVNRGVLSLEMIKESIALQERADNEARAHLVQHEID